ncbi:hypothetical protein D2T81_30845 [Azospirillum brasilense]|nr:hypothetical protein [Azospirillum brasilense]RIV96673.1 hypothetical protein D2T81_30845 [Azospirillum brasilense]
MGELRPRLRRRSRRPPRRPRPRRLPIRRRSPACARRWRTRSAAPPCLANSAPWNRRRPPPHRRSRTGSAPACSLCCQTGSTGWGRRLRWPVTLC